MARNLERVQDHTRHPPELRGDPIWLQEQFWENSRRLAELEKLGVALETLRGQGAEFQATLQTTTPPGTLLARLFQGGSHSQRTLGYPAGQSMA